MELYLKLLKIVIKTVCNADEKCNLDINIQKATFINSKQYEKELANNMNEIKTKIIKNKLNLIFKLDDEVVMIQQFDELKNSFQRIIRKTKTNEFI